MSTPLLVAIVGKKHGLKGEQKLHLQTDFPEQFTVGSRFESDRGELVIERYDEGRGLVKFEGVNTPEDAARLTNTKLYSTDAQSRETITLEEGEFFWFDIIGCEVYEESQLLGRVSDIERLGPTDYLNVKTAQALVDTGATKQFLIPYIDRYIIDANIEQKRINVTGGQDLLEAS